MMDLSNGILEVRSIFYSLVVTLLFDRTRLFTRHYGICNRGIQSSENVSILQGFGKTKIPEPPHSRNVYSTYILYDHHTYFGKIPVGTCAWNVCNHGSSNYPILTPFRWEAPEIEPGMKASGTGAMWGEKACAWDTIDDVSSIHGHETSQDETWPGLKICLETST